MKALRAGGPSGIPLGSGEDLTPHPDGLVSWLFWNPAFDWNLSHPSDVAVRNRQQGEKMVEGEQPMAAHWLVRVGKQVEAPVEGEQPAVARWLARAGRQWLA